MVVRMRHTRAHTRARRSHHALKGERLSKDAKSSAVHPRHKALLDGTPYRGRSVMSKAAKQTTAPQTTAKPKAEKETKDDSKKEKQEDKKES
ncbi:MAG: 50S ribosomal protein L32 [Candidatus Paceibacteria bacterium]